MVQARLAVIAGLALRWSSGRGRAARHCGNSPGGLACGNRSPTDHEDFLAALALAARSRCDCPSIGSAVSGRQPRGSGGHKRFQGASGAVTVLRGYRYEPAVMARAT